MNKYFKKGLVCLGVGFITAAAGAQTTERVSESASGVEGTSLSRRAAISADGRYTAFVSASPEFVPGDTNGVQDVFVRDNDSGTVVRVSVGAAGVQGNGKSDRPTISSNGRFVAFYSDAWNLVAGDTQTFDPTTCPACTGVRDIFVHDRDPDSNGVYDEGNGLTTRVSVSSFGIASNASSTRPALSGDGRYVAFRSSATNLVPGVVDGQRHVFIHDMMTGATVVADTSVFGALANDRSDRPALSGDGRFVAFQSDATNILAGANGLTQIYLRDRDADGNGIFDDTNPVLWRASVSNNNIVANGLSISPSLSDDGRFVEFSSDASNLVPGDANGSTDVFVYDRVLAQTVRVSVDSNGVGPIPEGPGSDRSSLSFDGHYIAFVSEADDLGFIDNNGNSDVFVRNQVTGSLIRVSKTTGGAEANDDSDRPSISGDGRFVAFYSDAWNLVAGDQPPFDAITCPSCTGMRDVIVYDRDPDGNGIFDQGNATFTRASQSTFGVAGNGRSTRPKMAANGRFVTFVSNSTNLTSHLTSGQDQVYVHDLLLGTTTLISEGLAGLAGDADSDDPAISADGRFVVFSSDASNLVPGDTPTFDPVTCPNCTGSKDVFVRDRDPDGNGIFDEPGATTVRVSVSSFGDPGNGSSGRPDISADGSQVVFHSDGTNLVAGDTNQSTDVFAHDMVTGQTTILSLATGGMQGDDGSDRAKISDDGRFVVFRSKAGNLVPGDEPSYDEIDCPTCTGVRDTMLRDRDPDGNGIFDEGNGTTTRVSISSFGTPTNREVAGIQISGDGTKVTFDSTSSLLVFGDTNNAEDVFLRDLAAGTTSRVSVDQLGLQLDTPTTIPISTGGRISGNGRFVVFESDAYELIIRDTNGDTDAFIHDRDMDGNGIFDEAGGMFTTRVSISTEGEQGKSPSTDPCVSADGSRISFSSLADNLITTDTNGLEDVFLRTLSVPCRADINGDGMLDFFDVAGYLALFSAGDLGADFIPDGSLDFFDVAAFLGEFAAGCP